MFETVPLVVWLSICGVVYAAQIGYACTAYLALRRCAPQNRTMPPGFVWLLVIPGWGILWWFANVAALGESSEKELRSRGVKAQRPHQALGRTAGWLQAGAAALLVLDYGLFEIVSTSAESGGDPTGDRRLAIALLVVAGVVFAAFLVTWIMYWVKVFLTWRRMGAAGPSQEARLGVPPGAPASWQAPAAPQPQAKVVGNAWTQSPSTAQATAAAESVVVIRRGRRNEPVQDFCPNCGLMTAVDQRCPRCGAARKPSAFIE